MACRRAIFELSESGGHQVEFDRLIDFGIGDGPLSVSIG